MEIEFIESPLQGKREHSILRETGSTTSINRIIGCDIKVEIIESNFGSLNLPVLVAIGVTPKFEEMRQIFQRI